MRVTTLHMSASPFFCRWCSVAVRFDGARSSALGVKLPSTKKATGQVCHKPTIQRRRFPSAGLDRPAPTFPCYGLTNVVVPGPMPVICTMTSSSLAPSKCTAFAGCFM